MIVVELQLRRQLDLPLPGRPPLKFVALGQRRQGPNPGAGQKVPDVQIVLGKRMPDVEEPEHAGESGAAQRAFDQPPESGPLVLRCAGVAVPRQVEEVVRVIDLERVERPRLAGRG